VHVLSTVVADCGVDVMDVAPPVTTTYKNTLSSWLVDICYWDLTTVIEFKMNRLDIHYIEARGIIWSVSFSTRGDKNENDKHEFSILTFLLYMRLNHIAGRAYFTMKCCWDSVNLQNKRTTRAFCNLIDAPCCRQIFSNKLQKLKCYLRHLTLILAICNI
jgi:hypothetical protein